MFSDRHATIDDLFEGLRQSLDFILVPGLHDSDPDHWQSLWHQRFPHWKRISQKYWNTPDIDGWLKAIHRTLEECHNPVILIGHSLGALASYNAAVCHNDHKIFGLFMVAPAEPARFELEHRIYPMPLSIPSVIIASQNDPLMPFARAEEWADNWGSDLIDIGSAGHINTEAGFGAWPYGLNVLYRFAEKLVGVCPI